MMMSHEKGECETEDTIFEKELEDGPSANQDEWQTTAEINLEEVKYEV